MLVTVMLNVWTILIVVNSIAISHLILQIIAVFKNLTAAIQVHNVNPEKVSNSYL